MHSKPVKTALVYAVDLLARRAYGTGELVAKLKQRGYAPEEIDMAVEKLTQRGYLDDAAFLSAAVDAYKAMGKYSWREIEYRLLRKGFSRAAIAACRTQFGQADELAAARKAVCLKSKSTGADILKIKRYLYAHGFSVSVIEKVCSETL